MTSFIAQIAQVGYTPGLGHIPTQWETRRVAWLFCERDERGEPELPLLEVSIRAGVVLREFSEGQVESTASDFNIYKVARKGDIVFRKMRMWQSAIGVAPHDRLISPDYMSLPLRVPCSLVFADYYFGQPCSAPNVHVSPMASYGID